MHELAVTKELIQLILAQSNNPKRVIVELGEMTTYKRDPIIYYFDIIKKEHVQLAETELDIVEVPAHIECKECMQQSRLEEPFIECCPNCQSWNTTILQGKDFILKQITEN